MKTSLGAKALIYPTPVWCIGSYDKAGKANAMTVAWGGICCSSPVCVTISLRQATYTYSNILERQAYTVNVPSERQAPQADYFGLVSGRKVDKFAVSGLTAVKSAQVDAPYIAEFPLVLECKVLRMVELGLHTQFIGQIMDVKAEPSILDERGLPDIKKVNPLVFAPEGRFYYGIGAEIGKAFEVGKNLAGR